MKNIPLVLSALCLSIAVPTFSAHAQEQDNGLDASANVGFVSDYAFRGISQSDEGIALQGGFDVEHDIGLYAGVWGSNIDFNTDDNADIEVDLYAGYSNSVGKFSYDVGAIYYAYPGADTARDYDFYEIALAAGYDFDVAEVTASINYSPDYFNESGDAQYYALSASAPLPREFSLSAHVGRQDIDDNDTFGVPDYTDWSIGVGYAIEGFDLSLTYVDTDLDEPSECADGCDARVIFGISRSF